MRTVKRFKNDVSGGVLSIELILIAVVCLIGMFMGGASIRDAITAELSDVGGFTQDMNQSYTIFGANSVGASTAGMDYIDQLDHCDDAEDTADAADNCITYDLIPITPISTTQLTSLIDFDSGDASDSSDNGQDNSGTIVGDPEFVDGVVRFDGDDAIGIPNSTDINLGIREEHTIILDFNADDVITRQVLYEQGAQTRGLVIYIDNGLLYVGGWNRPATESNWQPTFISTPITAGTDHQVALVLDGGPTVQPGALSGWLNGSQFGTASGSQLWSHPGAISIGGVAGATIFHDGIGNNTNPAFFSGTVDNFTIHNRALTDGELFSSAQ